MRIPSGSTDRYVYFVAVDATDFTTRETALSSFTVYRSRNGAAAAVMTTPTINETDVTNMAGVYELLLDEDTTVAVGNDTEELALHITHAGMAPVTRVVELYRPDTTEGNTHVVTAAGVGSADTVAISGSTTAADMLELSAGTIISATVDTVVNTHTPTTTEFQCDNVTEATANHYVGRIVIFTSGVLLGQVTEISGYTLVGGIGQFTVVAMTEAPADNDLLIII